MALTYNPEIFSVPNLSQAKDIILTAESSTTEERWKTETPMLSALIAAHNKIGPDTVLLDYGCGIGRMAKELIAKHGCRVIGVDISPSMRALSVEYVNSDNFFACPTAMLKVLFDGGLFVVNNIHRAVPTKEAGWASDGIDIKGTLARIFSLQSEQTLVSPDVPSTLSGTTFWAAFKKAERLS